MKSKNKEKDKELNTEATTESQSENSNKSKKSDNSDGTKEPNEGVESKDEIGGGDAEKLAELNDRYLRLVAEFDNYRRRSAKERMDLVVNAAEETIKGLLPILDDFERAIEVLSKSEGDIKAALEGTELIYNKLLVYLISKGLKKIEAAGEVLDTDYHEAVAQFPVDNDIKKNKIIDVVQQGYTLNGKVIRFAKVVVGV
ncbi:MAG: nucleotide exchange factor GrpE [Bacteroidales bacterium]|jgi:molecular chaperone GrpE|nr:nucleotide exchange factor GrpE [Bacteroidales bacterium]MDD4058803.1 nucleotide exchange factor GrpE [Bacteroidales bacterium]